METVHCLSMDGDGDSTLFEHDGDSTLLEHGR